MCSKGRLMIGPVIIEKTTSFYDKMRVTDKYTFCGGSNKKFPVRTFVSVGTAS